MQIKFYPLTDVGLVRAANEDSHGESRPEENHGNGTLLIVCDGMGGHVGGAAASQMAVHSIKEHFAREYHDNPYVAISEAIQFANEQIYARAQAEPELRGMGTTCTLALFRGDNIYLGHVGDSRIYLTSDDKLHRLTKDHSFVQTLVDQGIITDAESETHARKNELTQALGIKPQVSPTVPESPVQMKAGDKLMLCSDGLCGLVNDPTMQEVLAQSDSIENKAAHLIELAKNAGGTDNITVTLAEVEQSAIVRTVFVDLSPKVTNTTGPGLATVASPPPAPATNLGDTVNITADQAHSGGNGPRNKVLGGLVVLLLVLTAIFLFSNPDDIEENPTDPNPVVDIDTPESDEPEIQPEEDDDPQQVNPTPDRNNEPEPASEVTNRKQIVVEITGDRFFQEAVDEIKAQLKAKGKKYCPDIIEFKSSGEDWKTIEDKKHINQDKVQPGDLVRYCYEEAACNEPQDTPQNTSGANFRMDNVPEGDTPPENSTTPEPAEQDSIDEPSSTTPAVIDDGKDGETGSPGQQQPDTTDTGSDGNQNQHR